MKISSKRSFGLSAIEVEFNIMDLYDLSHFKKRLEYIRDNPKSENIADDIGCSLKMAHNLISRILKEVPDFKPSDIFEDLPEKEPEKTDE